MVMDLLAVADRTPWDELTREGVTAIVPVFPATRHGRIVSLPGHGAARRRSARRPAGAGDRRV